MEKAEFQKTVMKKAKDAYTACLRWLADNNASITRVSRFKNIQATQGTFRYGQNEIDEVSTEIKKDISIFFQEIDDNNVKILVRVIPKAENFERKVLEKEWGKNLFDGLFNYIESQ